MSLFFMPFVRRDEKVMLHNCSFKFYTHELYLCTSYFTRARHTVYCGVYGLDVVYTSDTVTPECACAA